MTKKLRRIYQLIPVAFQKKSLRYTLFSIVNVFFDLLSVAYMIPLFVFILDKEQMPAFLKDISFFDEAYLLHWMAGILLLFILKNYIQVAIIKFQSKLVFDIATSLSSSLAKRLLGSPLQYFQHLNKGKEIQKIQMAGTDFSNHILLSLNTVFTELTVISIIGTVSFILYPKFSILIFLIAGLCLFALFLIRKKKIQKVSRSIRTSYAKATSHLLNIIDGFLEIKSLKKESFFEEQYQGTLQEFNNNFAILKKHQNSNAKYLEVFIILGLCLFLYYLNELDFLANEKVLLISYIAGVSLKLFPSLNKLILAYTNYRSYNYTLEVLSKKYETISEFDTELTFQESISLEDISFSYNENFVLLKDINLTLKRGEIVGIKGRSGIGKTTLLYLTMGFLFPKNGRVLIDNQAAKIRGSIFPFVGYVPQQPFLFQGSLLNNIVMGSRAEDINYELIESLTETLQLTSFVAQLEQGLNTPISHNSISVSGGQKQRIALMRALYHEPQLLILDEVTNQLDEALEMEILRYLKRYALEKNIAIMLVSHGSEIANVCERMYQVTQHTLKEITID